MDEQQVLRQDHSKPSQAKDNSTLYAKTDTNSKLKRIEKFPIIAVNMSPILAIM